LRHKTRRRASSTPDHHWGTSIAGGVALFTLEQLSERSLPGAATYAATIYDMWECLTNGPPEIREYPRAILAGLVPNIDMRDKVFDFLEKQKKSSLVNNSY